MEGCRPCNRGYPGPRCEAPIHPVHCLGSLLRLAPIEELIPPADQRLPQFQKHRQARKIDPMLNILKIPGTHPESLRQPILRETGSLAKVGDILSETGAGGSRRWLAGRHDAESPKPSPQKTRLYLVPPCKYSRFQSSSKSSLDPFG
jgi:hypothetical protein